MNFMVGLFFLSATLIGLVAALQFLQAKNKTLKAFGFGLLLNSLAFAIWTAAVLIQPAQLEAWVTIGVVPFILSLLAYLSAGIQKLPNKSQQNLLAAASVLGVGLFALRTYVLPSHADFSADGLFFFNPDPVVNAIYVVSLVFVGLVAIPAASGKFKNFVDRTVFVAAFTTLVIGGILLLTTKDTTLLYLTGYAMAAANIAILIRFGLRSPRTWQIKK